MVESGFQGKARVLPFQSGGMTLKTHTCQNLIETMRAEGIR